MEKEVQSSPQDGATCELSVLADPTNKHSTKNLIEVLRARLAIEKGLQEKIQGSQSPREENLSAEGKVPQVQYPEQGVLQEKDSGHSGGL